MPTKEIMRREKKKGGWCASPRKAGFDLPDKYVSLIYLYSHIGTPTPNGRFELRCSYLPPARAQGADLMEAYDALLQKRAMIVRSLLEAGFEPPPIDDGDEADSRKEQVNTRISPAQKELLADIAKAQGQSIPELVRELIRARTGNSGHVTLP